MCGRLRTCEEKSMKVYGYFNRDKRRYYTQWGEGGKTRKEHSEANMGFLQITDIRREKLNSKSPRKYGRQSKRGTGEEGKIRKLV